MKIEDIVRLNDPLPPPATLLCSGRAGGANLREARHARCVYAELRLCARAARVPYFLFVKAGMALE